MLVCSKVKSRSVFVTLWYWESFWLFTTIMGPDLGKDSTHMWQIWVTFYLHFYGKLSAKVHGYSYGAWVVMVKVRKNIIIMVERKHCWALAGCKLPELHPLYTQPPINKQPPPTAAADSYYRFWTNDKCCCFSGEDSLITEKATCQGFILALFGVIITPAKSEAWQSD